MSRIPSILPEYHRLSVQADVATNKTIFRASNPLIDLFKVLAAQLITLHHLACYGPLAQATEKLAPNLAEGLFTYARMVVQVFLVLGGYLAARSALNLVDGLFDVAHQRKPQAQPLNLIANRYLRLTIPFLAALVIAVFCSAFVRHTLGDEFVPAAPTQTQWIAHIFLLHGVLGFDSLSAGAWYVAIDFQLFVLLIGLMAYGQRRAREQGKPPSGLERGIGLILGMGLLALFWFNRDTRFDNWAVYFFAAYALGFAAYCIEQSTIQKTLPLSSASRTALYLFFAAVVLALCIDFRGRLLVALCVALALIFCQQATWLSRLPQQALQKFGQISYAQFLVGFPVLLVINSLLTHFVESIDHINGFGLTMIWLATWAITVLVARVFYAQIEVPAHTLKIELTLLNKIIPYGIQTLRALRRTKSNG